MNDYVETGEQPEALAEPDEAPRRGRPGGEESRERLIEAAARLFALRGFDGVSTREIARRADVNQAAIAYHFDSKRGLYKAVLQRLIELTSDMGGPVSERLTTEAIPQRGDRAALAALAAWAVRHILGHLLDHGGDSWTSSMMLREFQEPSEDFAEVMQRRVLPLHDAFSHLAAAAYDGDPGDDLNKLRAHAAIGAVMGYGAARRVVWERLGWETYTPENVETVIGAAVPLVTGLFGLPAVEAETAPALQEGAR